MRDHMETAYNFFPKSTSNNKPKLHPPLSFLLKLVFHFKILYQKNIIPKFLYQKKKIIPKFGIKFLYQKKIIPKFAGPEFNQDAALPSACSRTRFILCCCMCGRSCCCLGSCAACGQPWLSLSCSCWQPEMGVTNTPSISYHGLFLYMQLSQLGCLLPLSENTKAHRTSEADKL